MSSYEEFLARRTQHVGGVGFEPDNLPDFLFPFQRDLVQWATRQGKAALFADCGLGKTPMQLAWADAVYRHTGKPVLIVTPLAVSFQTEREADKFGFDASTSRDGQIAAALTITNYERLENFDPDLFGGVVCDESSAIKAFDGKRRAIVTEFLRTLPYRLLCTATAAPNDYVELGTSSEALGQLGHMDMLSRFFTNKQKNSATGRSYGQRVEWRFKGHSEDAFWRWVSSWARALRKPSDLGFSDDGFVLPPLEHRLHVVEARTLRDDVLFNLGPANGLREEREEMRRTIHERCEAAAEAVAEADSAVAWCHLNEESKLLTKLIDGAVEVCGSDHPDAKEEKLLAFGQNKSRVLVTKPSIGAWGLNWQHCHRMSFFPSHSYESYYQAVRRSWRFGQTSPVTIDVITTQGSSNVLANLERKANQADRMFESLVAHMRNGLNIDPITVFDREVEVPAWLQPA